MKILCWLGFHRWFQETFNDGVYWAKCYRCGDIKNTGIEPEVK